MKGAHLNNSLGDLRRGEDGVRGNHSIGKFLNTRVRDNAQQNEGATHLSKLGQQQTAETSASSTT